MLKFKERRPAIRTLRGWAISVLSEVGAIRVCETHGWMRDRADPHARERALEIARHPPPEKLASHPRPSAYEPWQILPAPYS